MYRRIQTFLVVMGSLSTIAATDIFIPSLPSMAMYFGASEDGVQLSIPLYMLGSFMAAPILGTLSDHFGRHFVMIAGFALFLLGTAWCIYASTLPFFLTGRFIQGIGASVPPVIGWAMIQDLYEKDESAKIMSWVGSIVSVGPLIAPGLGGYIHEMYGWQGNFVLLLIFGSFTLILMIVLVMKHPPIATQKKSRFWVTFKNYGVILKDKTFLSYVSLFALLGFGEWCYLTSIPFYFEHTLGLSPRIFGLYISGSASAYILGTLCAPYFLKRYGMQTSLHIGIILSCLGGCLLVGLSLFNPTDVHFIALAIGVFFFGTSVVWGPSTSRALQCFEHMRGAASAVRMLILQASFAAGGFLGSLLNESSIVPLAFIMLALAVIAWIVLYRVGKGGGQLIS